MKAFTPEEKRIRVHELELELLRSRAIARAKKSCFNERKFMPLQRRTSLFGFIQTHLMRVLSTSCT